MNRHVQIVHIIADVLLFGTVTYVFNSRIRRQDAYIQHLESKIHYLHEKMSQMETNLSKIYVHYVASTSAPLPPSVSPSLNTTLPLSVPSFSPSLNTTLPPSVPSVSPVVLSLNESHQFVEDVSPPPSPTLPSELNKHQDTLIVDYTKDPIDKEIFEELQEVESYQANSTELSD